MKHSSNTGVHSENTVEEPIAVYSRSFVRGIRNMVLFLVVAAFILAWWLGISELINILLPLGFLIFFAGLSWLYAWVTRENATIKVFKSGIHLNNEFVNWEHVSSVKLKRADIDTISYSLVINKNDGAQLERDLNSVSYTHLTLPTIYSV